MLIEGVTIEQAVYRFAGGRRVWNLTADGVEYFRVEGDPQIYTVRLEVVGKEQPTSRHTTQQEPHLWLIEKQTQ
jgi:hypothetical protein